MCQIFNFFGAAKGAAIEVQNLNPIFLLSKIRSKMAKRWFFLQLSMNFSQKLINSEALASLIA
jgi:hypothetical protein